MNERGVDLVWCEHHEIPGLLDAISRSQWLRVMRRGESWPSTQSSQSCAEIHRVLRDTQIPKDCRKLTTFVSEWRTAHRSARIPYLARNVERNALERRRAKRLATEFSNLFGFPEQQRYLRVQRRCEAAQRAQTRVRLSPLDLTDKAAINTRLQRQCLLGDAERLAR